MTPEGPIVFVVDDDPSMRPAMESLIRSIGLRVKSFASASYDPAGGGDHLRLRDRRGAQCGRDVCADG